MLAARMRRREPTRFEAPVGGDDPRDAHLLEAR
jgi:hypothetical protein